MEIATTTAAPFPAIRLGREGAGAWIVARSASEGEKVEVAFAAGEHESVGVDVVHRCVNELLAAGAMPRGFSFRLLAGEVADAVADEIVEGVERGCRGTGIPLLERAVEAAPALLGTSQYVAAGTIVGATTPETALDGSRVAAGDVLVGIGSFGLHGCGVELARRIAFGKLRLGLDDRLPGADASVRRELLAMHKSYLSFMAECIAKRWVHALVPILEGGVEGSLARALPPLLRAEVETGTWPIPPLFESLRRAGDLDDATWRATFNLGLGMVAVVSPRDLDAFVAYLTAWNEPTWRIGRVDR